MNIDEYQQMIENLLQKQKENCDFKADIFPEDATLIRVDEFANCVAEDLGEDVEDIIREVLSELRKECDIRQLVPKGWELVRISSLSLNLAGRIDQFLCED